MLWKGDINGILVNMATCIYMYYRYRFYRKGDEIPPLDLITGF
jgi:hypothetical protein